MRASWALVIVVSAASAAIAEEGPAPWKRRSAEEVRPYAFHRPLTVGAIRLYQLTMSRARAGGCPMHPHFGTSRRRPSSSSRAVCDCAWVPPRATCV